MRASFLIISSILAAGAYAEESDLLTDLDLAHRIDKKHRDELPFFYNHSMVGGYLNMPSARMAASGTLGIGAGRIPPYNIYGANFQVLDRIELSGTYRASENCFFDNSAIRSGNIKIGLLMPSDGVDFLPALALGFDDFVGNKQFNSHYLVATQEFVPANVEMTLGYGWRRMKGIFGGVAWTPLRRFDLPFLNLLTLMAEYDDINYKGHQFEHADGRTVKSRINVGIGLLAWKAFQLSVGSVRGEKISAFASLRYPLGSTEGFFPKVDNPQIYQTPIDTQPLGVLRSEKELAYELAYGFSDQGLDLYTVYLSYDQNKKKVLWLKIINNRYREEDQVRQRIEHFLAAVLPSDIEEVVVVIEADGLPVNGYRFKRDDLYRFRKGEIDAFEMKVLAPQTEAVSPPGIYDRTLLFQRSKEIWTFTARPRLLTFFGSSTGKLKYNIAAIAVPEGYLFDEVYYKMQLAYSIFASKFHHFDLIDCVNPSQLPNVRTDTLGYYQSNRLALEQAFLQKGWSSRKGMFARLGMGYFEPAFGGFAGEALYYPVQSDWAVGLEAATVWKRKYTGLGFNRKIRKYRGVVAEFVPFTGVQYFLNLYYDYKPLKLDFRANIGQFLAKDKGVRFEVGRSFDSGVRFSIWSTFTNGHDKVNCQTYYDRGFCFSVPLDLFLRQSSRTYVNYAMSAWLRDVGAQSATGKTLFTTISEERNSVGNCSCQ